MKKTLSFVCIVVLIARLHTQPSQADDVLWMQSAPLNAALQENWPVRFRKSVGRFGLNDELAEYLTDRADKEIEFTQNRVKGQWSKNAWVHIGILTPGGEILRAHASRVSRADRVRRLADEYASRIDEPTINTVGNTVVVRGASQEVIVNGRKEINGWLPLYLKERGDWVFESSKDEFLGWEPTDELVRRLNQVADRSTFYESRPTTIPELIRDRLLRSTFATLETRKQRRDDESLEAYVKRVAPLELWIGYLRAWFFQTERISYSVLSPKGSQKGSVQLEIVASRDSELADWISEIQHGSVRLREPSTPFSLALALNIPEKIRSSLANLPPAETESELATSFFPAVAQAIRQGAFKGTFWCDIRKSTQIVSELRFASELEGSGQPRRLATAQIVQFEAFGETVGLTDALLEQFVNEGSYVVRAQTEADQDALATDDGKEAPLGTLLTASVDLKRLAEADPESDAGAVYRGIELLYFTQLCHHSPISGRRPSEVAHRSIRDQLRQKIVEAQGGDWRCEFIIFADSKRNRLLLKASLGADAFDFMTVANAYGKMILTRQVNRTAN